jgi:deoxyribose-phosphate aldolase
MRLDLDATLAAADARTIDAVLARRFVSVIDLTTLNGDETDADIQALCARAEAHGVAAVCVLPEAVTMAARCLAGSRVKLATVANFPAGGDDLAGTADAVAAAVAAGAHEVDIVVPLEATLDGDVGLTGELITLARQAAGPAITLKLILETGRLQRPELITAVARSAVMAGVDFLKTSTGKIPIGATPEAAALLFAVAQEAEGRVGVKISGGVRTARDAMRYWQIGEAIMGADWLTPAHFRFGASKLLDELEELARP